MATQDFLAGLRALKWHSFGRGATCEQIEEAQRALGIRFPGSYIAFLRECGWADGPDLGFYGLGSDVPPYCDLVRITRDERDQSQPEVPEHLLPVLHDGAGNHYCLDTSRMQGGECPVVFWDHEHEDGPNQVPEECGENFRSWLIQELDTIEPDD